MSNTALDSLFVSNIHSYLRDIDDIDKAAAWLRSAADKAHRGGDINARDGNGDTMLHVAVRRDNPDLAVFLLERGADTAALTPDGLTPFALAESLAMTRVLPLLQESHTAPAAADPEADVRARQSRLRRAAPSFRFL